MNQLDLFSTEAPAEDVAPLDLSALRFFYGLLERKGPARYVHIIRAANDPERGPRDGQTLRWRRLNHQSVEAWRERIVAHLDDGRPRTFNRLMLELANFTADVAMGKNCDKGLWLAVERRQLILTREAPIYFTVPAETAAAATTPTA